MIAACTRLGSSRPGVCVESLPLPTLACHIPWDHKGLSLVSGVSSEILGNGTLVTWKLCWSFLWIILRVRLPWWAKLDWFGFASTCFIVSSETAFHLCGHMKTSGVHTGSSIQNGPLTYLPPSFDTTLLPILSSYFMICHQVAGTV